MVSTRRAIAGAVLLDLAVSPLFAWDVFTDALGDEREASDSVLAAVFSVGLVAFMLGVRRRWTFPIENTCTGLPDTTDRGPEGGNRCASAPRGR